MAVQLKCGAVFLHIPKTGGSWVTRVFEALDLVGHEIGHKHSDMVRVLNEGRFGGFTQVVRDVVVPKLGKKARELTAWPAAAPTPVDGVYRFCFVRHPLNWYESWWKYESSHGWKTFGDVNNVEDWHPNAALNGLGEDDFNTFMRNIVERYPGYVTELFGLYTQPGISYIGKQESLTDDLVHVLKHLNINFDEQQVRDMKPQNVSRAPKAPIAWDPALKSQVERLEYAGLVRYGYAQ